MRKPAILFLLTCILLVPLVGLKPVARQSNQGVDSVPGYSAPAALSATAAEDAPEIKSYARVRVDGKPMLFDNPPLLGKGGVLISLPELVRITGATVKCDQENATISITYRQETLQLNYRDHTALRRGQTFTLPTAVQSHGDTLLVPLAYVCRSLGLEVSWDESRRCVDIRTGAPLPAPANQPGRPTIPILMYHEIGDGPNNLYVGVENFRQQMRWLYENQYRVVTLAEAGEMLTRGENIARTVALTFDDGYASFYTQAWPILKEYHFPATVFVITAAVDGPCFLSWEQLRHLDANWVEIGCHTRYHPSLPSLGGERLWEETWWSRQDIAEHLAIPVSSYCYPAGQYNPAVVAMTKKAGFTWAVTTRHGKASAAHDPLLLPRVRISRNTSLDSFARMLQ